MIAKQKNKKFLPAFTLNEMLVVLAIIGALLLIAYPNLMPLITKAKSQEAKINLKHIAQLQTLYYYTNSSYSLDFQEIDFIAPTPAEQGGTALYKYNMISADDLSFKVQAEAVKDFDGDGVYNLWEIDQNGNPKEVIKD